MIPLEQLKKHSGSYQFILEEGREQERQAALCMAADFSRLLADKRFPGITLGDEVEAVGDPAKLQRLCHEMDEIPDAESLHRKLQELHATQT